MLRFVKRDRVILCLRDREDGTTEKIAECSTAESTAEGRSWNIVHDVLPNAVSRTMCSSLIAMAYQSSEQALAFISLLNPKNNHLEALKLKD